MVMKNKVLHYYTTPDSIGGPNTYIRTICESELKEEYKFSCCYQMKPFNQIGIKGIRRIVCEIKSFSPDILHIHGIQGEGLIGALCGKLAKCPNILMTVHGMQNDSVMTNKLKRWFYRHVIENTALKLCDYVYCVCKATEGTNFVQHNARRLLPYIWNCVDEMPFYDKATVRNEIGILPDDCVIVSVGRITVMKGYAVLAEAIQRDSEVHNKYVIVGDGPYLNTMKQKLPAEVQKGKVIFVGQQSEVGRFLSLADIYVTATYKENLSISILEAGKYGLPCIVTDVGGNSEIIIDKECGLLIQPNCADELVDTIAQLSNNSDMRAQYGENLRTRTKLLFGKDRFIKEIRKMYSDILSHERADTDFGKE